MNRRRTAYEAPPSSTRTPHFSCDFNASAILVVVGFGVKWSVLDPLPVTNGDKGSGPPPVFGSARRRCTSFARPGRSDISRSAAGFGSPRTTWIKSPRQTASGPPIQSRTWNGSFVAKGLNRRDDPLPCQDFPVYSSAGPRTGAIRPAACYREARARI